MADDLIDKKITIGQADLMQAPLELDLWALFRVMEEDMLKHAEGYEGTPEQFIDDIVQMLSPRGGRVEKDIKSAACKSAKLALSVLKRRR